jgi:hypothetical protein
MLERCLRFVLAIGLVLVVAGLTLILYFDHHFDTWIEVDASAPAWIEAPSDPRESVFYQSDDLVAHAEAGRAAGLRLFMPGVLLALASGIGLLLVRWRWPRPARTGGE